MKERINANTQLSSFVFASQMNMRACLLETWYQTMNNIYENVLIEYKKTRKEMEVRGDKNLFCDRLGVQLDREKEQRLEREMNALRTQYKYIAIEGKEIYKSAQPFYAIKNAIKDGDLYNKVFRSMPKGGLLHVHSSAALSFDGLLELLKDWCNKSSESKWNGIYKRISIITRDDIKERYLKGMLLYTEQIESETCLETVDLGVFLANKDNELQLRSMLTINSERGTDIWEEFNIIFARTAHLFQYRQFYYEYHVAFFKECLDDNINYVELRSGFEEVSEKLVTTYQQRYKEYTPYMHLFYKDMLTKTNPINPDTAFLDVLLKAQEDVNLQTKDKEFKLRVILNARRKLNPNIKEQFEILCKKVDAAIAIKDPNNFFGKYKDFVIGFDFVSEEDRGQNTALYAEKIIYQPMGSGYALDNQWSDYPRIDYINFFLHDGESNWNDNDNVIDAAIISAHRIGHGFNMNKYLEVADAILANSVNNNNQIVEPVLEICPISNQLLRYIPDIRNHPARQLMKRGIGCVLGNDDPQILDNPGLSYDFWEAYVGMELSLVEIKAMVFMAYLYSRYPYNTKNVDFDCTNAYVDFLNEWNVYIDTTCAKLGI